MELKIDGVTKQYKNTLALNKFSITLTKGVYGLLGPNGAGKTTLINILVGLLKQDSGKVLYNGDLIETLGDEYIDKLGYLPQYPSFYKNFTANEFLLYMCALKDIPKNERKELTSNLLESVNLLDEKDKKIGGYSGGMKQRLGIAQAMINNPEILILDEPTAGLDPKERMRFRNIISSLGSSRIVILATHIVSDVEYISKEIILIKNGELIKSANSQELTNDIEGKVWNIQTDASEIIEMMNIFKVSNVTNVEGKYVLKVVSDEKPSETATLTTPTLEDVCLYHFDEGSLYN